MKTSLTAGNPSLGPVRKELSATSRKLPRENSEPRRVTNRGSLALRERKAEERLLDLAATELPMSLVSDLLRDISQHADRERLAEATGCRITSSISDLVVRGTAST